MTTLIYTLSDDAGNVRYVGKTSKTLAKRLRKHIWEAKSGAKGHRNNWIRSLLAMGIDPIMQLIETAYGDGCAEEIKWIAYHREIGTALVNRTNGGDGTRGIEMTATHRFRISLALTGITRSEETRKLINAARALQAPIIRAPLSEEVKERMRRNHSCPAMREKMGAANRGKKRSEESKAKVRAIKATPEFKKRVKDAIRAGKKVHLIEINGETLCLTDWSERSGIAAPTIRKRISSYGWTAEDAVFMPTSNRPLSTRIAAKRC